MCGEGCVAYKPYNIILNSTFILLFLFAEGRVRYLFAEGRVRHGAFFAGFGGGATPWGPFFKVWKLDEKKYLGQFSPYGKSYNSLKNLFLFLLEYLELFQIVPTCPEDPIFDFY